MNTAPPLGRIGQPDEVSPAIIYLLSDASAYTTGADILISGGIHTGVQDMMPTLATNMFQWWKQRPPPDMTITNDSVYTGDWNHLLIPDFGAIIQYEGRPRNSYPVIDGGI